MKRFTAALLIILLVAAPAFAAFSKKGYVPNGDPIAYRGLKVTQDGVSIIIRNKGERDVVFSAAILFLNKRHKELGDVYIARTEIPAGGEAAFKDLHLKGNFEECRKAESLRWTIYELEFK